MHRPAHVRAKSRRSYYQEQDMTRFFNLFATFSLSAALAIGASAANAQTHDTHEPASHNMPAATQDAASAAMAAGEIKKVDKDTGKLTIQHGPLTNLNMPGMTMAFKVQDPSMLDQVKVGDKIRFHVERVNGAFVVTRLEIAN
jgi:Cu/Ag efflux protein CusF